MASTDPMEDQISCAVCYEIYTDPHILRECFHTYCLQCINLLEQNDRVQCPECREFTDRKHVKKDFKLQGVIDAFHQKMLLAGGKIDGRNVDGPKYPSDSEFTMTEGSSSLKCEITCEMCHDAGKTVKYRCKECANFICSDCETVHQRMKVCETHTVNTIQNMIEDGRNMFRQTIKELESSEKHIGKRSNEIAVDIDVINRSEEQQLEDIDKFTKDAIKQLEENQKRLEKITKYSNSKLTDSLARKRDICEETKREYKRNIEQLNVLIMSEDPSNFIPEASYKVNKSIKEDMSRVYANLPKQGTVQSPVHTRKANNWDVSACIDIKVDGISQEFTQKTTALYSSLLDNKYKQQQNHQKLKNNPNKLCKVNNKIWCAEEAEIIVYDQFCTPIQKISHKRIQYMHGLAKTDENAVVVACRHNKGLHELDSDGRYERLIAEGSFSDVAFYDGFIYALEYVTCVVIKFKFRDGWFRMKEIKLHFNNGNDWDKLIVHKNGMHISSCKNRRIYALGADGQLQDEIKHGWNNKVLLFGIDDAGQLLVGDRSSCELLVYRKSGWLVVPIGVLGRPMDAFIDDHGVLWLAVFTPWSIENTRAIYRYNIQK